MCAYDVEDLEKDVILGEAPAGIRLLSGRSQVYNQGMTNSGVSTTLLR